MGLGGIFLHSGALGAKWAIGHAFGFVKRRSEEAFDCKVVKIRCFRVVYFGSTIGLRKGVYHT